ncbi:MAG: amidohydrolase family protein [Congregibacter sp.]
MNLFHDDQPAWLAQIDETIVDPEQRIIDPHHHLWRNMQGDVYTIDEYGVDTTAGHKVIGSVFMECGASYRSEGPEAERPLGESEFVIEQAQQARAKGLPPILGMVGHVDLRLEDLDRLLDLHIDLAGDFFKGIRQAGASAREDDTSVLLIPGGADADLYAQTDFRRGVQRLGERGLSYDTWHYHFQNAAFIELAQACPDTQLILDHFGTPLGVGQYAEQRDTIFTQWQRDIEALSYCPNVKLKLGGLAMPDNGFAWHLRDKPPGRDEFLAAQGAYYQHALDCFGASRCMFESNFPVDRLSLSYTVLYNALKTLAAPLNQEDRDQLFFGTAVETYRLDLGDFTP